MRILFSTMSALALASTLALAQDKPPAPPPGGPPPGGPGRPGGGRRPDPAEIFKQIDTNNDGAISLEEFKAGPRAQKEPAKAEEAFKKLDKDSDGKVTLEEFTTGRPQRPPGGPDGGNRRPGGPGGGAPANPPPPPPQ